MNDISTQAHAIRYWLRLAWHESAVTGNIWKMSTDIGVLHAYNTWFNVHCIGEGSLDDMVLCLKNNAEEI